MQADVECLLGSKASTFHAMRPEAERAAREAAWQARRATEVTLAEIYAELGERMGFDAAAAEQIAQLEIEAEQFVCHQNPFIHSLYRRCLEEGKRVAFLSDIYLPGPAIADILRRCGYASYDALLVSSTVGKTKATGELQVEARSLLPYGDWLHVGDNPHSDIDMARKAGMSAWHYKRCGKMFLADPRSAAAWKDGSITPQAGSVVQGLIANRTFSVRSRPVTFEDTTSDWQDLGYATAGPLFVGFTEWLIAQVAARDLHALYFLARDGRIMQRVYQALAALTGKVVENHYLYASRRALNLPAIEAIDEAALWFLTRDDQKALTVAQYVERLGLDWRAYESDFRVAGFTDPHREIKGKAGQACLRRLFVALAAPICARARAERTIVLDYLLHSGIGDGRNIGIVDIGWHGTMQRSITDILHASGYNPAICGFYLGTWEEAVFDQARHPHAAYLFRLGQPARYVELVKISVPIIEHMFSAPEGTILRLQKDANGGFIPVRLEAEDDAHRNESIMRLQQGAMQFVDDYMALKRRFPQLGVPKEVAVAQLERLLRFPTRSEACVLGDIRHAAPFGDLEKLPIARPPRPLKLLSGPRAFRQAYWQSSWREGRDARASPLQRALYRLLTR